MHLIKIILVAAAILAIAGIFLPQDYSVTRELEIPASVDEIHQRVENMDGWERWTAWDEAVPPAGSSKAKMVSGIGSGKYFTGTTGSGWFVITNSSAVDGFEYAVYYDDGDKEMANVMFFDLGGETRVTWTVKGKVTKPPVLAPYLALIKGFTLKLALRQNLENLKKSLTQADK